MELVYIIAVILWITVVITFFVISSNIGKIKRSLLDKSHLSSEYYKSMFYGDSELAKEKLKSLFWSEIEKIKSYPLKDPKQRLVYYNIIKKKYDADFKAAGLVFPEWTGNDTY